MAKLRFVADQPHDVPLLGRTLQPDELVEVSADVFKAHAWAETLWQVVDDKARKGSDKPEGA